MSKYYVVYDSTGAVVTRYDSDINADLIANPPAGLSLLEVPDKATMLQTREPGWTVKTGALVSPTAAQLLAQAQAAQIAIITQACAAAITSGFISSALGSAHTYPSGLTDQANLAANVLSSLLPGLPSTWTTPQLCQDANGVWAYVAHTAAQIQQVGSDGKAAILGYLTKKASLQAEIEAATTVASVNAIVW